MIFQNTKEEKEFPKFSARVRFTQRNSLSRSTGRNLQGRITWGGGYSHKKELLMHLSRRWHCIKSCFEFLSALLLGIICGVAE